MVESARFHRLISMQGMPEKDPSESLCHVILSQKMAPVFAALATINVQGYNIVKLLVELISNASCFQAK